MKTNEAIKGIGIITGMAITAVAVRTCIFGLEPPKQGSLYYYVYAGAEPSPTPSPTPTPHPDTLKAEEFQKQVEFLKSKLKSVEEENKQIKSEVKSNNQKREKIIKAISFNLGGVFKGKADFIYNTSRKYNLNPLLVTAIMYHETGNGTSWACTTKNNPAGLMGSRGLMQFATIENGIEKMCKVLKELYIDKGLTSIEEIQKKYCPIGAENDPKGLNKHWLPNVTSKYEKIIADAGGVI